MKKLTILIISILTTQLSEAQNFTLKTKKQQLEWTGKAAFSAYKLTGTLAVEKGKITASDDTVTSLEIIVNMKSLDHENSDLKNHLRNEDFFEVNTYKKATFILSKSATIKNGKAILTGMMTIKDKKKQETIEVDILNKNGVIQISLDHEMDRTAYNVKYNSPSFFKNLKQNAIADEFSLKGTLNFKLAD